MSGTVKTVALTVLKGGIPARHYLYVFLWNDIRERCLDIRRQS